MGPAPHTSTTDRLGPALALAAPGPCLHSDAFSSPPHSGFPLPFCSSSFYQGAPVVFRVSAMSLWPQDWPPVTMPAGPQHTSFSAISLRSPVHPCFLLLPRKATPPGLGIWLELGSRKGRVCGQKAKAMVGMKMWRRWERWIKTHRKMSAVPGSEGFGS